MAGQVDRILAAARATLGYVESPTNRTPFGAWYGMNGVPWCDIWVSYIADRAGLGDIIPKSHYVPSRLAEARRHGQVVTGPQPGDLACFDWGRDGVSDHIGIVEAVSDGEHVRTIEGNTSPDDRGNQSNGGGVYRRVRPRSQVIAFIRPPYDQEDDMPTADEISIEVWGPKSSFVVPITAGSTGEITLPDGRPAISPISTLARTMYGVEELLRRTTQPVDVDALATAIVAKLPPGSGGTADVEAIARAVVAELGTALRT